MLISLYINRDINASPKENRVIDAKTIFNGHTAVVEDVAIGEVALCVVIAAAALRDCLCDSWLAGWLAG